MKNNSAKVIKIILCSGKWVWGVWSCSCSKKDKHEIKVKNEVRNGVFYA